MNKTKWFKSNLLDIESTLIRLELDKLNTNRVMYSQRSFEPALIENFRLDDLLFEVDFN